MQHTADPSDARWLAHLLRLGLLPTGSSYPKPERPLRDLLRKRSPWVRPKTTHLLSIQKRIARTTGSTLSGTRITQVETQDIERLLPEAA